MFLLKFCLLLPDPRGPPLSDHCALCPSQNALDSVTSSNHPWLISINNTPASTILHALIPFFLESEVFDLKAETKDRMLSQLCESWPSYSTDLYGGSGAFIDQKALICVGGMPFHLRRAASRSDRLLLVLNERGLNVLL